MLIGSASAQVTSSLYYPNYNNLIDVNKSNFDSTLINYSSPPATTDEIKHYVTLCNISKKIFDEYFNPSNTAYTYNNNTIITNGLKIEKTKYCVKHLDTINLDLNLRMLVVRPNDTISRPCIMLTNGAGDQLNCRDYLFWKEVADFALRGYVVVFFENVGSTSFLQRFIGSREYPIYPLLVNGPFFGIPQISNEQKTKKDFYYVFQNSVAAYNYITQPSNPYKINFNSINGYGISLGSWAVFSLAYSRQGINYTNSDYFNFGNFNFNPSLNLQLASTNHFTRLCIPTRKQFNINMKAIAIGAFGYGSDMGDFFSTIGGKKVATEIFYGKNDNLINIFSGYSNGNSFINVGAVTMQSKLSNLSIRNRLIVNCQGEHSTFTNPSGNINNGQCNTDLDIFSTTTIDERAYRTVYLLNQMCDYNKSICQFINIPTSFPYLPVNTSFIIPQNTYNSNGSSSGHFIINPSGSCINGLPTPNINYRISHSIDLENEKNGININNKTNIYPNPANSYLTIEQAVIDDNYEIQLFNMMGEIVYYQNIINGNRNISNSIYTSHLPNGMYNLVIKDDHNNIITRKSIVISH